MTGIKEWVKVTVWIFKELEVFGPNNVKIICSLDFIEILCDKKYSKGSEKVTVFPFFRATLIMPKEPHFGRFRLQN